LRLGGAEFLYVYDAYGNLTNDGTSTYVYDAENRLISTTAGGVASSYTYNGDGDRISQTVDGTLTTYVLDMATPLTMVLSETSNGSTLSYWQGLDVLAQSDGTQTEYLAYDGLGSVRQVTDSLPASPAFPALLTPFLTIPCGPVKIRLETSSLL